MISRKLCLFKVGLYASSVYLKSAPKLKIPADLAAHQCLQMSDMDIHLIKGTQRVAHKLKTPAYSVNSMRLLKELVMQDAGIAMLSERMMRDDIAAGRAVRVLPGWCPPDVPVYALTETRLLPAKTRVFLDYLGAKLKP